MRGGYVQDPRDPGGETKYGISKRSYPRLDIRRLTREQAIEIYRRDFWAPMRCDQLSPMLAVAAFDCAVNQGKRAAKVMLQRALRVKADGVIGPMTLRAARRSDQRAVLADYMAYRALRYAKLSTFPRFGRGWMRRLFAVHQRCLTS